MNSSDEDSHTIAERPVRFNVDPTKAFAPPLLQDNERRAAGVDVDCLVPAARFSLAP
jgi:hypothetical protein